VTQLWSPAYQQRPTRADSDDGYLDVTQLDGLSCSLHKCLLTLPICRDEFFDPANVERTWLPSAARELA
jgi:hypothetical protein